MLHFTIDKIFLIIAIITGLGTLYYASTRYMKAFPFFLLVTIIVEFCGQLIKQNKQSNIPLYNLFMTAEFAFYSWVIFDATRNNRNKKWIGYIGVGIPFLCLLNIFFIQGLYTFQTYTYVLGSVAMIVLGILYIYSLYDTNEHVDAKRVPAFWIAIGIIFFYVCAMSQFSAVNYLAHMPRSMQRTMQQIMFCVNCILYSLYTFAFLCQIITRKSLSSL